MALQTITFITDWQKSDFYLGALKGKIVSQCNMPMNFVDISHQIPHYQYKNAAFVLRNSFHYFPKGTIHVITVNDNNKNPIPYIATYYNNHFFISPDSGILNLLTKNTNYKAVKLVPANDHFPTFPELDYVSKSICHIMQNNTIDHLGEPYAFKEINYIRPTKTHDFLTGNIAHMDGYGNIITNISKKLFEEARRGRTFSILLKGKEHGIDRIHEGYEETTNEIIAVFNSASLLEIAHMNYPAYKSLGLLQGDLIKITFK